MEEAEKWEGYRGVEHQESDTSTDTQSKDEDELTQESINERINNETIRPSDEGVIDNRLEFEVQHERWLSQVRAKYYA